MNNLMLTLQMLRRAVAVICRTGDFARGHLVGMTIFGVLIGVVGNFVYDAVKPDKSGVGEALLFGGVKSNNQKS